MKAQHTEPGHTAFGMEITADAAAWLVNLPPIMQALQSCPDELQMLGDVLQAYFVLGYQHGYEDGRKA